MTTTTWKQKRAQLARLSQDLEPDAPVLGELRRDIRALRLEEHVAKIVAEAPPLTDDQRTKIAALLRVGGAA